MGKACFISPPPFPRQLTNKKGGGEKKNAKFLYQKQNSPTSLLSNWRGDWLRNQYFLATQLNTYSISGNNKTATFDCIANGYKPSRLYLALQETDRLNGKFSLNALKFPRKYGKGDNHFMLKNVERCNVERDRATSPTISQGRTYSGRTYFHPTYKTAVNAHLYD